MEGRVEAQIHRVVPDGAVVTGKGQILDRRRDRRLHESAGRSTDYRVRIDRVGRRAARLPVVERKRARRARDKVWRRHTVLHGAVRVNPAGVRPTGMKGGSRPVAIVGMPLSLKSENQSSEAVIKLVVGTIFVGTKSR